MTIARKLCILTCLLFAAGCVHKISYQGVTNLWRSPQAPQLQREKTTVAEVLSFFGPPSQIISSGERTIFYYLLERRKEWSLFLILYNATRERILYDRAIFVFDAQQRLIESSYSKEQIPFHEMRKP